MKKLILIDGNNILFRSYYATASMGNLMKNSQGIYTNAVYGFVNTIQALISRDFTHILVAFDCKGKTFRHDKFEAYKGTRKEAPEELIMQMPLVREYLDAAGVARYEQDHFEADDIIGYCATKFDTDFDSIEIFSNDHDMLQLLSPKVSQVISKKGLSEIDVFTNDNIVEKLGIRPDQMADYKGLVGDASDNIPGIPGVGDKTAIKLLSEYQTLENVFAHATELKGKLGEKVVSFQEQARFSKEMATIIRDFPNEIKIDNLEYKGLNYNRLKVFLVKMEFRTILQKLEISMPRQPQTKAEYRLVKTAAELVGLLDGPAALHLELFGNNYHTAKKIGFGVQNNHGKFYIDYDVIHHSEYLQSWLANPDMKKDVYDLKQTKVALMWDGYDLNGVRFDLLLGAYLLNPNLAKDDFRNVISAFDSDIVQYDEEIYGRGAKYVLPDDQSLIYRHIVNKVNAIAILKTTILDKIAINDQMSLLNDVEIPLAATLAKMEFAGIAIDSNTLQDFGLGLITRIQTLEKSITVIAGEDFNINSPKQLGVILFEKLNLPYYKKNKNGYSTDVSVLEQLIGFHPIIEKIMEYRTLTKLYSTYYEGIKTALDMKNDGKVHTIYKQTITQTGRLSSVEPNLQNIPVRTDEGKEIRKIFVAEPGYLLYSCDYSQIELRVLAHMANVEALTEAFVRHEDIHTHTAQLVFHKEEVSTNERRAAKAVNFGIIYGKTAWGLSEDLHISPKQAELFISDYFLQFPQIKTFMDQQIETARTLGYVQTILNRRRYIPEIGAENYQTREFGKRMAMNAPIQGSAADILKVAMVQIQAEFDRRQLKSRILLQIHDELVFAIAIDEKLLAESIIKDRMEHAVTFSVPLTIECSYGNNLFEVA
ncbi:MAG: DNA polymerase I [Candidatus Izemoplasmatales bacterium]